MTVYAARAYYNGDGVTTSFPIPFPYISQSHLAANVGGLVHAFSVVGSNMIISPAPAVGVSNVEVLRVTPEGSLEATIQAGTINPGDVNLEHTQLLYIEQELADTDLYAALTVTSNFNKTVQVSSTDTGPQVLPAVAGRYGQTLGFDPITGNLIGTVPDQVAAQLAASQAIAAAAMAASASPVTPQQFGAFADGTQHLITSGDIAAHPQWIGRPDNTPWQVGDSWDTVGTQEAFYACFAQASTPGNVKWNSLQATPTYYNNKRLFVPHGRYRHNHRLDLIASQGLIQFEGKGAAQWIWDGSPLLPMWFCNSISYMVIENPCLICTQQSASFGTTPKGLWTIDHDGTNTGLATQQLTISNAFISVGSNMRAVDISPSGGAAQGDTLLWLNPILAAFAGEAAFYIGGQNALDITFVGGDVQGFRKSVAGGVGWAVYGMDCENQATYLGFTPVVGQIQTGTADFSKEIGAGPTAVVSIRDVRSEGDVACHGDSELYADNVVTGAASQNQWFNAGGSTGYPWVIGTTCFPDPSTQNNAKQRTFLVCEDGGPTVWKTLDPSSTSTQLVDLSGGYSINQYQNKAVFFRYGNGFTENKLITSMTATQINLNSALLNTPATATALYKIGGLNGATCPNFDGATPGYVTNIFPGTNVGVTTVVGSNLVAVGGDLYANASVNDYIAIPLASKLGRTLTACPDYPEMFIAKITAKSGGNQFTVSKNALAVVTNGPAYVATPITDGDIKWMEVPFSAFEGCSPLVMCAANEGVVRSCGTIIDYGQPLRADWCVQPANAKRVSVLCGPNARAIGVNPNGGIPAGSATIDLTPYIGQVSAVQFTPDRNTTLNFPAMSPASYGGGTIKAERFTIHFITSGTTSYTITFGTNCHSSGTYVTGTLSAAMGAVNFDWNGLAWVQNGRQLPV